MNQRKFNIQVPIESVPFKVDNDQKRVLEEMIIDLYDAVGRMLIYEDEERIVEGIKENAADHIQELLKLVLDEKKYTIEVMHQKIILAFDVEIMMEKYDYDKKVIRTEIENLDLEIMEAIFLHSDGTIVIPLLNYHWVAVKKGNQIKVEDPFGVRP